MIGMHFPLKSTITEKHFLLYSTDYSKAVIVEYRKALRKLYSLFIISNIALDILYIYNTILCKIPSEIVPPCPIIPYACNVLFLRIRMQLLFKFTR